MNNIQRIDGGVSGGRAEIRLCFRKKEKTKVSDLDVLRLTLKTNLYLDPPLVPSFRSNC